MDWGNAIVRSKTTSPSGTITSLSMDLHLSGDFRKTKKKITWLAQPTATHPLSPVTLLDYDYLITKKKLEESDNVEDFVTPVTEFREEALADAGVGDLGKGDIMQFERKGYFVFDGVAEEGRLEFIKIPDGRAASLASKAGIGAAAAAGDKVKGVQDMAKVKSARETKVPVSTMYHVEKVYGEDVKPEVDTRMYKLDSVYDS